MIGALFTWLTGSRFALAVGKWGAIALTISLFQLSLRRSGKRVGRNGLKTRRKQMENSARCLKWPAVALMIGTNLLSTCATVNSEPALGVCPQVVEYSQAEQVKAANEIETFLEGAILIDWLADYSVLREQAGVCNK